MSPSLELGSVSSLERKNVVKFALEGVGFSMDNPDVVIEDERGHELRVSASEALELMELLENNAEILRQVRDDEKKRKGRRKR